MCPNKYLCARPQVRKQTELSDCQQQQPLPTLHNVCPFETVKEISHSHVKYFKTSKAKGSALSCREVRNAVGTKLVNESARIPFLFSIPDTQMTTTRNSLHTDGENER